MTKDYLDARLAEAQASTQRWMLTLMATQWLGFAGMILAFVLKG